VSVGAGEAINTTYQNSDDLNAEVVQDEATATEVEERP